MSENISWTGSHPLEAIVVELRQEYDAAIARAEAAEAATIEVLENILLALDVDPNGIDEIYMEQTATGVIAALRARAASSSATREWRPVTTDNPAPMQHVVIDTQDGVDVGWRLPELPDYWHTRRGRSYITGEIRGWLGIPAPDEVGDEAPPLPSP